MNLVNEDGMLSDEGIAVSNRFHNLIHSFLKELHEKYPPQEAYNLEAILQSEIHSHCAENRIDLRSKKMKESIS